MVHYLHGFMLSASFHACLDITSLIYAPLISESTSFCVSTSLSQLEKAYSIPNQTPLINTLWEPLPQKQIKHSTTLILPLKSIISTEILSYLTILYFVFPTSSAAIHVCAYSIHSEVFGIWTVHVQCWNVYCHWFFMLSCNMGLWWQSVQKGKGCGGDMSWIICVFPMKVKGLKQY